MPIAYWGCHWRFRDSFHENASTICIYATHVSSKVASSKASVDHVAVSHGSDHRAFYVRSERPLPIHGMVTNTHHWGSKNCRILLAYQCAYYLLIYMYIYMYKYYLINPSCPEESLKMTPAFRLCFGSGVCLSTQWKEGILESPKIRPYVL